MALEKKGEEEEEEEEGDDDAEGATINFHRSEKALGLNRWRRYTPHVHLNRGLLTFHVSRG